MIWNRSSRVWARVPQLCPISPLCDQIRRCKASDGLLDIYEATDAFCWNTKRLCNFLMPFSRQTSINLKTTESARKVGRDEALVSHSPTSLISGSFFCVCLSMNEVTERFEEGSAPFHWWIHELNSQRVLSIHKHNFSKVTLSHIRQCLSVVVWKFLTYFPVQAILQTLGCWRTLDAFARAIRYRSRLATGRSLKRSQGAMLDWSISFRVGASYWVSTAYCSSCRHL